MAFKTLSRATAVVATCVVLAGCVAPHQADYDRARAACAAEGGNGSPNCQAAYQLGQLVTAEKQEQAAKAAAFASGMLAVSAGLAAAAAASQPHYYVAPVYVCRWPYC